MASHQRPVAIYLEADLLEALRLTAACAGRSLSDIVNELVRLGLDEDADDLAAFQARIHEPVLSYEALLADLRGHGKQ